VRGEGSPTENTLAAFSRALEEGADGVELDVRLTRDGHAVVFHDPRLADGRLLHTLDRRHLPSFIPLLEEALDVCRDRIVNVELKSDLPNRRKLAREAVRVVARAPKCEIVWSSFHPLLVLAVGALAPQHERGILVGGKTSRLATALPLALRRSIHAVHLQDPLWTPTRITRLAATGLRLVAWTVNDVARAHSLAEAGVSWIITDRPVSLVKNSKNPNSNLQQ
jgi:glycerophosphoryl diester phosphodiesterase